MEGQGVDGRLILKRIQMNRIGRRRLTSSDIHGTGCCEQGNEPPVTTTCAVYLE
jgi:hypothetical protein